MISARRANKIIILIQSSLKYSWHVAVYWLYRISFTCLESLKNFEVVAGVEKHRGDSENDGKKRGFLNEKYIGKNEIHFHIFKDSWKR